MASLSAEDVVAETAAREAAGEGSCVGAPVPSLRVRLRDPDTGADVSDGVGEVVVTSTVNREGSFGGQIAAGAKLEVSGTISKSDEDVLSVTPVLPR